MSDGTQISWTDATLNVVTGCTRVSSGCDRCYIERTPPFRMAGRRFDGDGIGSSTGVMLHPERLEIPLRWRKPRRIFVCSLADLFHDDVPDEFIAELWRTMAYADQHVYQILTKRPARMRSLLSSETFRDAACRAYPWPLPNVWCGVSVESQQWADTRIPILLDTPAAVRWISAEPLLSPVRLPFTTAVDGCTCYGGQLPGIGHEPDCGLEPGPALGNLHWVVTGGESGRNARPAHPGWFRALRDQCQAAGVAYHHKQNGEWQDGSSCAANSNHLDHVIVWDGRHENAAQHGDGQTELAAARLRREPGTERATVIARVGKHRAGRLLGGRTWDEYPAVAHGR